MNTLDRMPFKARKALFERLERCLLYTSDHCFGLPGLTSTLGMLGPNGELVIHGPKEIESYMRPILDIFCKRCV